MTEDSLLPKSKICTKCGEEKLLGEFGKLKKGKYGKRYTCKLCRKQYQEANKEKIAEQRKQYRKENKEQIKQYREANKEKITEYRKQYSQDNKEKVVESRKKYYEANKEKISKRDKQYRKENKEKLVESRKKYYEANKEKIAEYSKQYSQDNKERTNERARTRRKNDEQYRIRCYLSSSLWSALNNVGKTKNASILTYIGCSIEFMQEHLNSTKKPDWGDDLHIDHIIPQSLFDHTNEEEIKKCWNWRNLRYLPAKENTSKQNALDMDLIKSYGIEDLLPEGVDK